RAAPAAARAGWTPTRAVSQLLRKVAGGGARLLGALVARFLLAQHGDELVDHRDEKNRDADDQRELRDPDRHADQPLRDFVEGIAVIDEARYGPEHVDAEERRDAQRHELGIPAREPGQPVEEHA